MVNVPPIPKNRLNRLTCHPLWWLPEGEPRRWLAAGYGSQLLVVAPESRVVVAVTASLEPKNAAWEEWVLEEVRELARSALSTGNS